MRRAVVWLTLALTLGVVGFVCMREPEASPLPQGEGPASLGLVLQPHEDGGAYVLAVSERSPAYTAGVKPGDVIVASGKWPIQNPEALDALLDDEPKSLPLTVKRDNRKVELVLPVR